MEHPKLGELIDATAQRDAVHIAIAPVVAAEPLSPGRHIGFLRAGNTEMVCNYYDSYNKTPLGIVDPFLRDTVPEGERFYMFLYPKTITSLHHLWSHPAFEAASPAPVSHHEQCIRNWCDNNNIGYQELMDAAEDHAETGDYWNEGDRFDGFGGIPDEFWDHYEAVTGTTVVPENRNSFFSCSC